jgi:hypothetical protein
MWPLLQAHLASWRPAWSHNPWHAIALWLVFFAGLGLAPVLATWVRARRTRLRGAAGIVGVLAAAVVAAIVWAPPHVLGVQPLDEWLKHVLECVVSFGGWKVNDLGVRIPWPSDEYWSRAPVGILVLLLAIVALFRRHRGTWKWAILAGLFLVIDVSRATPWDLGESVRGLPLLSWIRRTREQLNFFLFFTLTLLAGRAVHWHGRTRWRAALQPIAWGVLILNVLYLGWNVRSRPAARPVERDV